MESPDLYFPELSPIENDMLCKNYSIGDSKEILIITIDIGDGRKDEIQAYEYDDSDQLALDFCYKHMLGARAKILLADEIEKYLKIAIQRANSKKIQENPAQGLNRARRSQSFTQKSMQVKRSLTRKRTPVLQPKHSVSVFSNKFLSVQETSDSPRLKHQRSLSKSVKSDSVNLLYQATEVKGKGVNKRSPVRCNSLYTKIEESSPEKSSDKVLGYNELTSSKAIWIPDVARLDHSETRARSLQIEESSKILTPTTEKSQRIMKKIKYQRYKEIFAMLIPDSKGLISRETVYKSVLPLGVRKLISPLIEELQELNETLDFNEFYDAMEMLMKSLTPGDKSAILLPAKPKPAPKEEYDFKPKTNVGQGIVSNFGLYERGVQKKQEISRRIEKEKEVIHEAEMKECKFVPKIINNHRRYKSTNSITN